jgi:hypothetical protein
MELDRLDDGCLYLLLPERLLCVGGADSDDYDRACSTSDHWLNLLPVRGGTGLVLGGDPGMVLVVPGEREEVMLVRWVCADDEYELVAFALRGENVARTEPDFVFNNVDDQWRLFNAARPVPCGNHSRHVVLPVGRVRIRTAFLRSLRNSAIVHCFSPDRATGT